METSLLSKGLSFCPTAQFNPFNFEVETFKFERLLKLKEFFSKKTTIDMQESDPLQQFRLKSNFMPPGQFSTIENFTRTLKHDVFTSLPRSDRIANLTPNEKRAMKSLRDDKSIIIKPADKGGAIVIMNYSTYRYGMTALLADTQSYTKLTCNPWPAISNGLKSLIDVGRSNGWWPEKVCEFLFNEFPRTPVIYGLPKIHKGIDPLKFRPIVAGTDSITQPLAQLLDFYLQPLVRGLPAYIKDTGDFLTKLQPFRLFQPGWLLASMDISSLYTSIPNEAGIQAVKYFLAKNPIEGPPSEFISDCLHFVLSNNCFRFEDAVFSQIKGTAMGSSAAPAFANLFMGYLEEVHIAHCELFIKHVKMWVRFIDDVFVIWEGTLTQFTDFVGYLNGIFSDIIFNPVASELCITFLDVSISIKNGILVTSLFNKPTDRNTLLHARSSHPRHLKNSIPISQFKRVIRICSDTSDMEEHLEKMYDKFLDRGYSKRVLDIALARARKPDCSIMSRISQPDRPLFVQCFNKASPAIKTMVNDNLNILRSDPSLPALLKRPPMHAYSRSKTLRDILVQADPRDKYAKNLIVLSHKKGCYKCHACNVCSSLICGASFSHPHKGHNYPLKDYFNCNTTMCVYLLKCPCGLAYVGKTIGPFKVRFQKHRSDIRIALEKHRKGDTLDPNKPVAIHFVERNHQTHELRGMVIDHVPRPPRGGDRGQLLLRREAFWIFTLDTVRPKGLNTVLSLTCFLPDR